MNGNIGVIIPTYNRKECLRSVLNCLKKQTGLNVEINTIVIVDGSTDGTFEMLETEFPDVLVICGDGNWWYTKCINVGLKRAIEEKCDYMLTLNDDVFFDEKYLVNLMMEGKKCKGDYIIGSSSFTQTSPHRITFSGVKSLIKWRLKELNYIRKFSIVDVSNLNGIKPSINLSGRGMFFNVGLINKIGLLDENLRQYSSDTDFSYRAYKSGITVAVSYDAKIFENEKLTSVGALYNKTSFKDYMRSFSNPYSVNSLQKNIYYFKKHGNRLLLPVYLVFITFASIYVFFNKYRKV